MDIQSGVSVINDPDPQPDNTLDPPAAPDEAAEVETWERPLGWPGRIMLFVCGLFAIPALTYGAFWWIMPMLYTPVRWFWRLFGNPGTSPWRPSDMTLSLVSITIAIAGTLGFGFFVRKHFGTSSFLRGAACSVALLALAFLIVWSICSGASFGGP
ncbi:MAG: hypothetical protein GC159_02215 [Phycisphaera sp.]|nr:hypothetical protein [Phycisphaera sp.]